MSARLSGWTVAWCVIVGLAAVSCGQETPPPVADDGSAGSSGSGGTSGSNSITVSVGLPPVSGVAGGYVADFGVVPVGETRGLSVSIENHGRSEVVVRGAGLGAPFGTDLPVAGLDIAPGGMAILTLRFAPTTPTLEAVVLSLIAQSGAEALEVRIALMGLGVVPSFSCTPVFLDFGLVFVGAEVEVSFRCQNDLDAPVSVRASLVGLGSEFTVTLDSDGDEPIVVPPRGAVDGRVSFRPLAEGFFLGKLHLLGAGGNPLVRTGIQAVARLLAACLEVLPSSVDFRDLCGPATGMITVSSRCDGVVVDSIEIDEEPSSHAFQIVNRPDLPVTLAAGAVEKVGIKFTPIKGDPREVIGAISIKAGEETYRISTLGLTAATRDQLLVIGGTIRSTVALDSTPVDRNDDGVVDEQDFEVYFGDTRIEPTDEDGRAWSYDPDTNAIVLKFVGSPSPGTDVWVRFTASCAR